MKKREVEKLVRRHLLPGLGGGFECLGTLVFRKPVREILVGYVVEGSSFSATTFTMNAFAQPLYVPSDHLYFNFGGRLGQFEGNKQEKWWDLARLSEEAIFSEVLQLMTSRAAGVLEGLGTPAGFVANVGSVHSNLHDPYRHEAVAYSLILAGEAAAAREALEKLDQLLIRLIDEGTAWAVANRDRCLLVSKELERHPDRARDLLVQWIRETGLNLRLGDYLELGHLSA